MMDYKMNWGNLFSEKRERESTTKVEPHRNSFDLDYDRIISSSSLRRLQDKTQVFPLQQNDFTRTRLTHSLETSALGRSIGEKVGLKLKDMNEFNDSEVKKLSSLLMVTGLVHDIGNPPFGHFGEDIIGNWCKKNTDIIENVNHGSNDFLYFDGNAQTIRILTRLQFLRDRHGLNFCYGTLGTLLKYPWDSNDPRTHSKEKFGYFLSESELIRDVIKETGIIKRHPATYLLEAVDDISNIFADLEDAVKKRYLPWFRILTDLKKTFSKNYENEFKYITKYDTKSKKMKVPEEELEMISVHNFRIAFMRLFIDKISDEFIDNYMDIMNGEYKKEELLSNKDIMPIKQVIKEIFKKYIYCNKEVITLELVGESVMNSLLNKFIHASLNMNSSDPKTHEGKIYKLISRNFKYVQHLDKNNRYIEDILLCNYDRIQLAIDFISGMSDSYCLKLHRELTGITLPEYK